MFCRKSIYRLLLLNTTYQHTHASLTNLHCSLQSSFPSYDTNLHSTLATISSKCEAEGVMEARLRRIVSSLQDVVFSTEIFVATMILGDVALLLAPFLHLTHQTTLYFDAWPTKRPGIRDHFLKFYTPRPLTD